MKTKTWMLLGTGIFVCVLGLGTGVHASTKQVAPVTPEVIQAEVEPILIEEVKEVVVETAQAPEVITPTLEEDTTTSVECPNGHINCDGIHANGECPYGNEPGNGPKDGTGYRGGQHINCPNGHINCDGNHANGECPYGNEPGSGPKDGTGYRGNERGNGQGGRHGSGLHRGNGANCRR